VNIVPLAADVEPLKLTDWITAVGTAVALGMSGFALWWQRRLLDTQLKHDLYERRLEIYHQYRDVLTAQPELNDPDLLKNATFLPALINQHRFEFDARCLFGSEVRNILHDIHCKYWEANSNTAALKKRRLAEDLSPQEVAPLFFEATEPLREAALIWVDCSELIEEQLKLYDDPMHKRAWWRLKTKFKKQSTL